MNASKAYILSGFLALAISFTASAARIPVTLLEGSVESTASDISLPANETGIITVRSCPSCTAQTFYFAKEPLLMANGRRVDLPQMRAALQRAGNTPVTVHFLKSDSTVSRILLIATSSSDSAQ